MMAQLLVLALSLASSLSGGQEYFRIDRSDTLLATRSQIGGGYETSTAATRADAKGRHAVVISVGGPPKLVRFFATSSGIVADTPTVFDLPEVPGWHYGTDNVMARLADGRLLLERDTGITEPFPAGLEPAWADEQVTFRNILAKGARGAAAMVVSDRAGQNWQRSTPIDFGFFEGGKYGIPRAMADAGGADVPFEQQGKNPDGTPKWWIGGCDRTEIYVCPFTHNVYVSTRIISGPYKPGDPKLDQMLVIGSTDNAKTWKLVHTVPAWSPLVMTSTEDGRLWMFQEVGDTALLHYSEPTKKGRLPSGFHDLQPKYLGLPAKGPAKVWMEIKIGHPSIARLLRGRSKPAVLLSYQVQNAEGNQEFRIMKVALDSNGKASVEPVGEIKADRPATHSAMYGTFVQPELVGEPRSAWTDTTLFFWYDAKAEATTPRGAYGVRYTLFRNGKPAETGYLTRRDNRVRIWPNRIDPGDYLKGASFLTGDGRVVFVPNWMEPDGLHAVSLTVGP